MKYFKELLEKKNRNESILAVLFIVYLLSDMQTPHEIAGMIDTVLGKVAIMLGALTVFLHTNPIVGVLALLTAYEVIKRSSQARGTLGVHQFLPNEQRKNHFFTSQNQFPVTLEEEVVKKMAPIVHHKDLTPPSFRPVLDDGISGSKL
jgi:hypothetical protein